MAPWALHGLILDPFASPRVKGARERIEIPLSCSVTLRSGQEQTKVPPLFSGLWARGKSEEDFTRELAFQPSEPPTDLSPLTLPWGT